MSTYPKQYQRLLELWSEIDDLENALSILSWDEQTQMPASGYAARAEQKATLGRLVHERIAGSELGQLLDTLASWEQELDYHSDEASIIRVARRQHERATKLPTELVTEMSRTRSFAFQEWLKARDARDFKLFAPALSKIYDVTRRATEALGYNDHPMDALLDQREQGMTVQDIEALFAELRNTLVPLVKDIADNGHPVDDSMLHKLYDRDKQWDIGLAGVRAIGFKLEEGRADISVHPFSTTFSPNDVRITTRVYPDFFSPCFFAFLHEAGHGHYMQGIPVKYRRTPISDGASAGMHESQSRMWENLVGRSRGFWERFYPVAQAYFPNQTKDVSVEAWYRAVNKVHPSFIRVEADEVTYNLHIMIRFELEKAVYDGQLAITDLAEAWNAKFNEYLGITPPDDLVGVLQDIHWTGGFGAGFQGYTLGNVIALQLYEAALRDRPELAEEFTRGNYGGLLTWNQQKVHAHGSKYGPQELVEIATGRPLSAKPYLKYITEKFKDIYRLK